MDKGSGSENYYDILNVRSDCSDKEIKTAYVQLSKKVNMFFTMLTENFLYYYEINIKFYSIIQM